VTSGAVFAPAFFVARSARDARGATPCHPRYFCAQSLQALRAVFEPVSLARRKHFRPPRIAIQGALLSLLARRLAGSCSQPAARNTSREDERIGTNAPRSLVATQSVLLRVQCAQDRASGAFRADDLCARVVDLARHTPFLHSESLANSSTSKRVALDSAGALAFTRAAGLWHTLGQVKREASARAAARAIH
jgi:hypothetical protein